MLIFLSTLFVCVSALPETRYRPRCLPSCTADMRCNILPDMSADPVCVPLGQPANVCELSSYPSNRKKNIAEEEGIKLNVPRAYIASVRGNLKSTKASVLKTKSLRLLHCISHIFRKMKGVVKVFMLIVHQNSPAL